MKDAGCATSVLHVISTTQRRGAEVLASELSAALQRRGWTSSLVALTPAGDGGLDAPSLGSSRLGWRTIRSLRQEMRGARIVIAHGSTTLPACMIAGIGLRTPVVYRSVGDPRFWAPTGVKRARTAMLLRRAVRVVALTDDAARTLRRHYGLHADRVVVIPKGVDGDRLPLRTPAASRAARLALDLPSAGPIALVLGALSPEKNVTLAIEAAATFPNVTLVVAGTGPERQGLESVALARGGRVRFVGAVSDPAEVLLAADVLLLPSHTEGMPGVAMEAGMVGIPVVTTDVGWVRDIVVDGLTGVVVPLGDPAAFREGVRTALANGASLGASATARCRSTFDLDRIAERWADLLDTVRS